MAAPIAILLFVLHKAYTGRWTFGIKASDMDLVTGVREFVGSESVVEEEEVKKTPWKSIKELFI
jgi:amino acid permease